MKRRISGLASTLWRPAAAVVRSSPGLTRALSLTALTSVVILVVNLGSGIIQARALGPQGRGELTTAMIWPALITGIGCLGLYDSVAYHAAKEQTHQSRVPATAFAIAVPQTLMLVLIGLIILPIVLHGKPPQLLSETRFYLLWIVPLVPLTLIPEMYLLGRLAMRSYNAALLCNAAVSTAMLAALWASHRLTVHSALAASVASWGITAGLCFVTLLRRRDCSWRPSLGLARPLLWFGIRSQIGNIATIALQQRLDLVLLSVFVSTGALGTYAVAGSAGMVALAFSSVTGIVLYPVFARQTAATLPFAMSRFLLVAGVLTLVAGPALLVLIPLAVPYVFGPAFESARPLSALLTLAYLIRGWNGMLVNVIIGSGRPFTGSIGPTTEFAALAILLATLIPRFGMTGAATAMILAAATSLICLLSVALLITKLTPIKLAAVWAHEIRAWRHQSVADHVSS